MTPSQVKLIVIGVVVIASAVAFRVWLSNRDAMQDITANAEQGVRTDEAASGMTDDAQELDRRTDALEAELARVRRDYARQVEEARNEDPDVAQWLDTPVPQRLRDIARARREARERSGRDGDGGADNGEAAPGRR